MSLNKKADRLVIAIRTFSVITLLAPTIILIVTGDFTALKFLYLTSAACAILLLFPARGDNMKLAFLLSLLTTIMSVIFTSPLVTSRCRSATVSLIFILIVTLPVAVTTTINVISIIRDMPFLSACISGWETALIYIRQVFVSALLFMICVFYAVAIYTDAHYLSVMIPMDGVLAVFYALLMARSLSGTKITDKAFLLNIKAPEVVNVFLRPLDWERVSINYRILYKRVVDFMEERRPYLSCDYSMEDMSRDLFTNKCYLSRMINSCIGMTFPQFMNSYRVMYAMELFKKDPQLRVPELASLSGFRNKVTFNSAFRSFNHLTPGEWMEKYMQESSIKKSQAKGEKVR